MIEFNVNDPVQVRLTERGREIERASWAAVPGIGVPLPCAEEDADGWSRWQLWDLMRMFGQHMYNGCQVPFETTIRIEQLHKNPTPPTPEARHDFR